jgi:HSP20 family protein
MEVRLLNNEYMPNGWLANQLTGFWKDFTRDMDGHAAGTIAPAVDITEDADGYHFTFEVPGMKADSLEVRYEDGRLVVEAERPRPERAKETNVLLSERTFGKFSRSFTLPEDARHEDASASYKDGILSVNVPKMPEKKPVRIKVATE